MGFVGGAGLTNIDLIYAGADHLPAPGEEVFARSFGMYLGGGAPATLVNLGRLGLEVRLLTFLGDDVFSAFAAREFERAGAQVVNLYAGESVPVVLSTTMLCGGDRAFMSYVERPAVTGALLSRMADALRGAEVAPMEAGYLPLYRELKAGGTRLVFDTGWEDDLSIKKYAGELALADWYLPNRAEALKITGAATVRDAARVLAQVLETPVIKLDAEGCLIWRDGRAEIVPPVPGVRAEDPTGAGDAFRAGFIYGLSKGMDALGCAQCGNITGAACVQKRGCLTGWVSEAELLRTRERVYGS